MELVCLLMLQWLAQRTHPIQPPFEEGSLLAPVETEDAGPGVALEVVMGRLPWSQASCSGVNGGVVLIVERARARETSNLTTG